MHYAKCKQAPAFSEDSWCLGGSGWEVLGSELIMC